MPAAHRIRLLHEAMSALDNRTRAVLPEFLERRCVVRLAISRRSSTIRHVDGTLLSDRGRNVECGRDERLIQADGVFAGFYRRQRAQQWKEGMRLFPLPLLA